MRHRLIALSIACFALLASCSSEPTTQAATESNSGETSAVAESSEETTTDSTQPTDETGSAEAAQEADDAAPAGDAEELFPDVINATAELDGDGTWTISATLSSPYDSPERYADAWQVIGPDGTAYGERFLTHDHAGEQPFTRSESGIEIPDDVDVVTIQGRDQVSGWGGQTFELVLSR